MKRVTVIDVHGQTQAEITVSDNEARYFEDLPFTSETVSRVDVTDED